MAILVVNGFLKRGGVARQMEADALQYAWIVLCLREVVRHSEGWDYEVFVYDNSHLKPHRELALEFEHVKVFPRGPIASIGRLADRLQRVFPEHMSEYVARVFTRQHPDALDYLASKVTAEFDYIVTLDSDSFPVADNWLDVLVAECEQGAVVAGVYRDEMAPKLHPFIHVSCLCMSRRDFREFKLSFSRRRRRSLWARGSDLVDLKMRLGHGDSYSRDEYNQDVGQKVTYEFLRAGRKIGPLKRSNKVNYHFLIGGIYGDVIYHHGAGSRPAKIRGQADIDADEKMKNTLREAAFRDIDHLVSVLRGQVPPDLDLTVL